MMRRLRIIRFRLQKTRSEMDDILEVKKNTWKAIESRGIIPAIVLKRLVEDINVSPLFLITGAGPVFVGNEIVFIP